MNSADVVELVDSKMELLDAEGHGFTRTDRVELTKQGVQVKQILRGLADIKAQRRRQSGVC